jgi:hypothetical protein
MRTATEIIGSVLFVPDPDEPEAQIIGPRNARNIMAALTSAGLVVVDARLLAARRGKVSEFKVTDAMESA